MGAGQRETAVPGDECPMLAECNHHNPGMGRTEEATCAPSRAAQGLDLQPSHLGKAVHGTEPYIVGDEHPAKAVRMLPGSCEMEMVGEAVPDS